MECVQMLLRRLAAMFYDALLLIALLFVASLPFTMLHGGAIENGDLGYQLYLLAICFIYLAWQWTHGGQTLGMKTWRLRIVSLNGGPVSWQQSLVRTLGALLSIAAFGLGYLWLLIDKDRLAWHDRLSGTKLVIGDW